jgi:twinkle protein
MVGTVDRIHDRRISQATCAKYGVTVQKEAGEIIKHHYPIHDKDGRLVGSKVRVCAEKRFYHTGGKSTTLFGQNTCRGKGKYLTVTEGEVDAMAVSEMFENKWDVVSLSDGASSAAKAFQNNLEFLEGYDYVVVCFDNDKPGQDAVNAVKDILTPGKVRIVSLPMKDAGAMLQAGKVRDFLKAWWDAKVYTPDGIVHGDSTWDAIVSKRAVQSLPYPWRGLNDMTRGMRPYELVTITSGTGMGKSQIVRELEHYLLGAQDGNIGILALEEDIARTAMGIMSVEANRLLHLDEDNPTDGMRPYWERTLGTGRYYLFDHFGSTETENLLARVRYMAKGLNCNWVFLDHLSIVVSAQDNGDERKAIDEIMTKLRSLVQETGIGLFLVSHLSRQQGKGHEEGCQISLNHLRGSQAIAQLSDIVLALERDQQHDNPRTRDTTTVRVLKNRYTGETGPCCYLYYNRETGRMMETGKPTDEETKDEF